jgi:hypothetical protein
VLAGGAIAYPGCRAAFAAVRFTSAIQLSLATLARRWAQYHAQPFVPLYWPY